MTKRTRRETFRNTDPQLKARDARWTAEAKRFAREQMLAIFQEPSAVDLTVADVMARLDIHPAPPVGYVRYMDSSAYPKRYQIVRAEAEKLHREGALEAGTTVNAKGREDVICYRKARPRPRFQVELDPKRPEVEAALARWVEENEKSLEGLDTVLITRVDGGSLTHSTGGVNHENGKEEGKAGKGHGGGPGKARQAA